MLFATLGRAQGFRGCATGTSLRCKWILARRYGVVGGAVVFS